MYALFYSSSAFADTYTYDELNRLTSVSMDSGEQLVYSYDAAGNITSVQQVQAARAIPLNTASSSHGPAYGWETYSSIGVTAGYEAVTGSVYGDGVRVTGSTQTGGEVIISQAATVTGNTYYQLQGGIQIGTLKNATIQAVVQFYNASDQLIGETNAAYSEQTGTWQALSVNIQTLSSAVNAKIQFKILMNANDASADLAVGGIRLIPVGGQS